MLHDMSVVVDISPIIRHISLRKWRGVERAYHGYVQAIQRGYVMNTVKYVSPSFDEHSYLKCKIIPNPMLVGMNVSDQVTKFKSIKGVLVNKDTLSVMMEKEFYRTIELINDIVVADTRVIVSFPDPFLVVRYTSFSSYEFLDDCLSVVKRRQYKTHYDKLKEKMSYLPDYGTHSSSSNTLLIMHYAVGIEIDVDRFLLERSPDSMVLVIPYIHSLSEQECRRKDNRYYFKDGWNISLGLYSQFITNSESYHVCLVDDTLIVSTVDLNLPHEIDPHVSVTVDEEIYNYPIGSVDRLRRNVHINRWDINRLRVEAVREFKTSPQAIESFCLTVMSIVADDSVNAMPISVHDRDGFRVRFLPLLFLGERVRLFASQLLDRKIDVVQPSSSRCKFRVNSLHTGLWMVKTELVNVIDDIPEYIRTLLTRMDSVNGFCHTFQEISTEWYCDAVQLTTLPSPKPKNTKAWMNAAILESDPAMTYTYDSFNEYYLNTMNDEGVSLPTALYMKLSYTANAMYKQRSLHLPTTVTRELPRSANLQSVVRALNVRNYGVAHLNYPIDTTKHFYEHIEEHAKILWVDNWRELIDEYQANPVQVDLKSLVRYIKKMDPEKRMQLERAAPKGLRDTSYYYYQVIIKQHAKNQVVRSKTGEPQTVFFSGPEVSGSAQSYFMQLRKRYDRLHKKNCFSPDGRSKIEVEHRLNNLDIVEGGTSVQRDLSAYDKSLYDGS